MKPSLDVCHEGLCYDRVCACRKFICALHLQVAPKTTVSHLHFAFPFRLVVVVSCMSRVGRQHRHHLVSHSASPGVWRLEVQGLGWACGLSWSLGPGSAQVPCMSFLMYDPKCIQLLHLPAFQLVMTAQKVDKVLTMVGAALN